MPRCCSSSRTRTGSTPRPRTCSRSWLGESSPTRWSCWPPRVTATPRRSPMRGCPSTGSPASTTTTAAALLDAAAPDLRAHRTQPRAARGRRQPARAARAAGGRRRARRRAVGARRPAADRAPRARVRRARRPSCPMPRACVLLVAALSDGDAVGEILEAAGARRRDTAGSRRGGAGRRGGAHRPRRQLDPLPAPAGALRGPAERRRAAAPPRARGARRDARRRSRPPRVAPRRADERDARGARERARRGRGARPAPRRHRRRRDGAAAGGAAQRPEPPGPSHVRHRRAGLRARATGHRGRDAARDRAPGPRARCEVARARFISELMDARALADRVTGGRSDRHRRAGRRGRRSRAAPQPALDRRRAHVVVEPGPGHPAADRRRRRSRGTARRRGSAAGLDPRVRRSARQRAEGPRLPARRRGRAA